MGTDVHSRLKANVLLTQETLEQLHDFNLQPENWDIKSYAPGTKKTADDPWAGGRARRLFQLAYTIAFTCLLRVDEVLKIQCQDIKLVNNKGEVALQVTLPFRKTEQFGGKSNHILQHC